MDDFIDQLLSEDRVCDVILPRIQKRSVLEESNLLEVRQSLLNEDLEDLDYIEELETVQEGELKERERRKRARDRRRLRYEHLRSDNDREFGYSRQRNRDDYDRSFERDRRFVFTRLEFKY